MFKSCKTTTDAHHKSIAYKCSVPKAKDLYCIACFANKSSQSTAVNLRQTLKRNFIGLKTLTPNILFRYLYYPFTNELQL